MGLEILKAIEEQKKQIPDTNRAAITCIVPNIQRNYSAITGINRAPKFFYRQATVFDDYPRKSLMERFLDFYYSVSFASRERGFLIEEAFQDAIALRERFGTVLLPDTDLWTLQQQMDEATIRFRKAMMHGDKLQIRHILFDMKKILTAMQYAVRQS